MKKLSHHKIKKEKWASFPKKAQLLNIAAELSRIYHGEIFGRQEEKNLRQTYERALELIDLTVQDPKWKGFKDLYQLREAISALYLKKSDPVIVRFFYNWLLKLSESN